jgi:hypothetical protein
VTISAALAADLRILTAALDEPGADIAQSLQQLAADTIAGVPSYLGLSLIVSRSDPLLTSTYLVDGAVAGDVRTSVRLTLPGVGIGIGIGRTLPAVTIILYAASPGAFVDLAADLAWLTARRLSDFALDQHLTIPAGSVTGGQLHVASAINQAIGVLIGRGYTPQQAHRELDTEAATAGTNRHSAALLILVTLVDVDGQQDCDIR